MSRICACDGVCISQGAAVTRIKTEHRRIIQQKMLDATFVDVASSIVLQEFQESAA
jgi:hypothetical protein